MLGCEHLPEAEPLVNIKPNLSALFYLRTCIGGGGVEVSLFSISTGLNVHCIRQTQNTVSEIGFLFQTFFVPGLFMAKFDV